MWCRIVKTLMGVSLRLQSPGNAACAAALIALTALGSGFMLDDYLHLSTLEGDGYGASTFDLFIFGNGDPDQTRALIRSGVYPWFALPELKVHFFRPLASATMWLDHLLFGRAAWLYHLVSALWYALLSWAVVLIYRRTLPGPIIGLAALFYILDDGHLGPVQWLSNRNAIVASVPALLGLAAHLRWREEGWRPGLPLSLLGYSIGLLGGETGLGIFGFVGAYEAIGRRDAWTMRLRALMPAAVLAMSYLVGYKALGYGVYGSGAYLDPMAEGPTFLAQAPGRLLDLISSQCFKVPVELPSLVAAPTLAIVFRLLTLAAVILLFVAARQFWRHMDVASQRSLLWLGAGSVAAALPSLAALPSTRLLTLPSVGAAALVALVVHYGLASTRDATARLLPRLGNVFVVLHGLIPPVLWIGRGIAIPIFLALSPGAFHVPAIDENPDPDRQVFTLYSPDLYTGFYTPIMRKEMKLPPVKAWYALSQAPFDHEVTRTADNRFELRVLGGEMLSTPVERILRGAIHPLAVGTRVSLDSGSVEVMEMGQWGPTQFSVTLEKPLESPDYLFLAWEKGVLQPFAWPPVGESRTLRQADSYFAWANFKKRFGLL